MADPWADACEVGVAVLDPTSWSDDGDAYTLLGVSRPVPTTAPVVNACAPATLAQDDPAQEVLVQGSGFMREDRVVFGGATPPTGYHTDTELAVWVDPSKWQPGTLDVLVGWSTRGPSNRTTFDITAPVVAASSGVPEGTVAEVLDWVGEDPERARQALEAERAGQQRTTLTSQLEALTG